MQLPGGFKAELIAAEPDLVQPMAFTFDERGRIWVVEGNSYPQPREVGKGQDRIKILEDQDGDGTFETKKIFCEGLNLVSGIELGFGGVWVGAAPYLMFIPDKDRNDQPDPSDPTDQRPKVPGLNFTAYALLDGWGTQDTHETLNSFIWGPDGWLYGCHGVFTHSRVGKPGTSDDQREPINAGVWRYHPVRHEFEVFAHGTSNPWGLDYDQHGEFFVTACVIPHLYHIVPGGRYQRQAGQHFNAHTYDDIKTIADHAHYAGNPRPDVSFDKATGAGVMNNDTNALGGGHAHCGLAIYQSSLFPSTYRNQLLFGNLHGHRLVTNYTDPHASTYIGKHGSDFLRSNDMHFIPVTQKVGPDGALYVSDWSDQQICHRGSNAVENWDRSNGRIYRVTYCKTSFPTRFPLPGGEDVWGTSWKTRSTFDLAKESDEALAKLAVQTENEWFSRMARRVLMERVSSLHEFHRLSKSAALFLRQPLWHRDPKDSTPMPNLLRRFWTAWVTMDTGNFPYAYNSPHEVMRAWSVRLGHPDQNIGARQNLAVTDKSPLVRRELASSLPGLRPVAAVALATALLKHGEDKDDPMIPLLIWYGIEPLVAADPTVGMQLVKVSKMPKVTEFIYRRLSADDAGRAALLRALAGLTAATSMSSEPRGTSSALSGGSSAGSGTSSASSGRSSAVSGTSSAVPGTSSASSGRSSALSRTSSAPSRTPSAAQGTAAENAEMAHFTPEERETILAAVVGAARGAGKLKAPSDWPAIAEGLRAGATPLTLTLVQELAALFGDTTALGEFRATLADAKRAAGERQAALSLLIQAGDAGTAKVLQGMLADTTTPGGLRRQALQALASLKDAETPQILGALGTAKALCERIAGCHQHPRLDQGRRESAAQSRRGQNGAFNGFSPFLVRQLTAFDDAEINALIKSAWGDVNAPKADLGERTKKYRDLLTPAALAKGDLAKGKMLYTATCGQCHKLFGEGQNVGPDITGSNRADLNYCSKTCSIRTR
jgi:putative membrane-bound dehydrogenase-like protein